jgi:hypothetical protein
VGIDPSILDSVKATAAGMCAPIGFTGGLDAGCADATAQAGYDAPTIAGLCCTGTPGAAPQGNPGTGGAADPSQCAILPYSPGCPGGAGAPAPPSTPIWNPWGGTNTLPNVNAPGLVSGLGAIGQSAQLLIILGIGLVLVIGLGEIRSFVPRR